MTLVNIACPQCGAPVDFLRVGAGGGGSAGAGGDLPAQGSAGGVATMMERSADGLTTYGPGGAGRSASAGGACALQPGHAGPCVEPPSAVQRALEDARTLGAGFLMFLPSGKAVRIPPEAVSIDPQKVPCNLTQE